MNRSTLNEATVNIAEMIARSPKAATVPLLANANEVMKEIDDLVSLRECADNRAFALNVRGSYKAQADVKRAALLKTISRVCAFASIMRGQLSEVRAAADRDNLRAKDALWDSLLSEVDRMLDGCAPDGKSMLDMIEELASEHLNEEIAEQRMREQGITSVSMAYTTGRLEAITDLLNIVYQKYQSPKTE